MKRWLKLKEAADYSCIGRQRLVELARKRVVRGIQDPGSARGDWVFDRETLDAYWLNQDAELHEKSVDILRSLG